MRSDELPEGQSIDYGLILARMTEMEWEVMWIIAALARRTDDRTIRISFREVLEVNPRARIERYEDPGGRFIEYRLRD